MTRKLRSAPTQGSCGGILQNLTFYILHLHFSKFAVNCQAPYSFTPFLTLAVCPPLSPSDVPRRRHRFGPGGQSSSIKAKPGQARGVTVKSLSLSLATNLYGCTRDLLRCSSYTHQRTFQAVIDYCPSGTEISSRTQFQHRTWTILKSLHVKLTVAVRE